MRLGFLFLLVTLCAGLSPSVARAGAWNQQAGEGQFIVTTGWYHASKLYQNDRVRTDLLGYTKIESRIWVEVGLSGDFTLVANGAYQNIDYRDSLGEIQFEGFDDIEVGVQWQLKRKEGLAAALRASYILDSRLDNRFPDIQSNGDTLELRALLGQSRETVLGDIFHDTQLAFRLDQSGAYDSVYGTVTLGYKPTNRAMLLLQGFADHAENRSDLGDRTQIRSQLSTQLSLVYQYRPGQYVQFGAKMAVGGRNAVKDRALLIGAWTEY